MTQRKRWWLFASGMIVIGSAIVMTNLNAGSSRSRRLVEPAGMPIAPTARGPLNPFSVSYQQMWRQSLARQNSQAYARSTQSPRPFVAPEISMRSISTPPLVASQGAVRLEMDDVVRAAPKTTVKKENKAPSTVVLADSASSVRTVDESPHKRKEAVATVKKTESPKETENSTVARTKKVEPVAVAKPSYALSKAPSYPKLSDEMPSAPKPVEQKRSGIFGAIFGKNRTTETTNSATAIAVMPDGRGEVPAVVQKSSRWKGPNLPFFNSKPEPEVVIATSEPRYTPATRPMPAPSHGTASFQPRPTSRPKSGPETPFEAKVIAVDNRPFYQQAPQAVRSPSAVAAKPTAKSQPATVTVAKPKPENYSAPIQQPQKSQETPKVAVPSAPPQSERPAKPIRLDTPKPIPTAKPAPATPIDPAKYDIPWVPTPSSKK